MLQDPAAGTALGTSAAFSRFVQRVRRRYAAELPLLPAGLPDAATMQATLQALRDRGHDLAAALRMLRQLVLERLAVLDVDGPTDRHGTPPRLLVCELGALGYARVRREAMADGAYLMIFRAPTAAERPRSVADVRARVASANCRA